MIASTYFEFSSWYHNHNVVGDDRQCCPYCLLSASGMLIFVQKTYTSTRALTFVIRNHWQTKYVWCFKKGRAFNETTTLKSTAMPVCKTQLHNLEYYQGRWTLSTWHQHFFQIHEIRFLFRKRQAAEWFAEDKLDKCLDTKPIKRIKNRNFTRFTCIYLYCPMAAGWKEMEDRSRLRENRNRWSASDSLRTRCQWRAKRFNQHSMCPEGQEHTLLGAWS